MADRVGPALAPAHPAPLQPLVDYRSARRLDVPRADLPTRLDVARIVHPIRVVADVLRHLTMDLDGRLGPAAPVHRLQRRQDHRPALVLERMAPTGGQGLGG